MKISSTASSETLQRLAPFSIQENAPSQLLENKPEVKGDNDGHLHLNVLGHGGTMQSALLDQLRSRSDSKLPSEGVEHKKGGAGVSAPVGTWTKSEVKQINDALKEQKALLNNGGNVIKKALKGDKAAQAHMDTWFGTHDKAACTTIQKRIADMRTLVENTTEKNCVKADQSKFPNPKDWNSLFAYVYPNDTTHQIHLGPNFWSANVKGPDSTSGTLAHEMSHFNDIGGTKDAFPGLGQVYGQIKAKDLATNHSAQAMQHADCFEYFLENAPKKKATGCFGCFG